MTLFFDSKLFFFFKKWHNNLQKYWLLVCIVLWACAKSFRNTQCENITAKYYDAAVCNSCSNPLNRLFSSATEAAAFLIFRTSHSILFWKLFSKPFFQSLSFQTDDPPLRALLCSDIRCWCHRHRHKEIECAMQTSFVKRFITWFSTNLLSFWLIVLEHTLTLKYDGVF